MRRILTITRVPIVLALVAGAVLIAGPAQASPVTFTAGDFEYSVNGDGTSVTVSGWDVAGSTDVEIPATASDGSTTYDVTAVGEEAFDNHDTGVSLTSVVIPDSVISIDDRAFYGNTALASLVIGDQVKAIGEYAFSGPDYEDQEPANVVASVVIPDSVETIGEGAFAGDLSVTELTIGSHVTAIGAKAFLFDSLTSVDIPDSVVSIGASAFYYNSLVSVTIGNRVETIGASAFAGNQYLASVTFAGAPPTIQPAGETGSFGPGGGGSVDLTVYYGTGAGFGDPWEGYHSFELGSEFSYTVIDGGATIVGYDETGRPTDLDIPSVAIVGGSIYPVTGIGEDAFPGKGITSVVIPDSVTKIDATAFLSDLLTSVTIPDSVETIGNSAFACNHLTSVSLGSGLVELGESAFACNDLTTVTIPKSVTTVGDGAFTDNPITSAIFDGDAPDMTPAQDIGAFGEGAGLTIYYYAGATGFSNPWYGYATRAITAAKSSLVVTPEGPLAADDAADYTVTVTVRDDASAPVAGVPVSFTIPEDVAASDSACTTAADGTCSITLTSTTVGRYDISATIGEDPLSLSGQVVFATASTTSGPDSIRRLPATGQDAAAPFALGSGLALAGVALCAFALIRRRRALV